MAEILKSDFNDLFQEDCKIFNNIASRYIKLECTDRDEAYELMKKSWAMAQRFSELSSCGRKVKDLSGKSVPVTEFKTWCHERYSQMCKVHESCRVIWRSVNEATK